MRKKYISIFLIIFILCFNKSVHAQNIAVINIDYVINNNIQYQEIINKIIKSQEIKKNNFTKQEEIINSKLNDIENTKMILNEKEIQLKINEYNIILSNFKDSVEEFNLHYDNQISTIKNSILEKILKLLEKYAIEKKIDLIFDNKNYIIASNSIDITDIISKELNTLDLNLYFDPL